MRSLLGEEPTSPETSKTLGLPIPANVIALADQVIE
jgi:hypothetical protein